VILPWTNKVNLRLGLRILDGKKCSLLVCLGDVIPVNGGIIELKQNQKTGYFSYHKLRSARRDLAVEGVVPLLPSFPTILVSLPTQSNHAEWRLC